MTQFPAQRVALEPVAQLYIDEALLQLATDIQINQTPVPQSIIRPSLGLWPEFTSNAPVLYYRTPAGVATFEPVADSADLSPQTVTGNIATGEATTSLIAALNVQGIPLTDDTTNTPILDLTDTQTVSGAWSDGTAGANLIAALIAIGLPLVDSTTPTA